MGNYRFRLSDMMPNAWFYRLKDMGRAKNHSTNNSTKKKQSSTSNSATQSSKPKQTNHQIYPRKSYYFTRELIPSDRFYNYPTNPKSSDTTTHFLDPPRKSSKQKKRNKRTASRSSPKLVTSSVSAGCNCRATLWTKSETSPLPYSALSFDNSPETEPRESFPPELRPDRVLAPESFDNMVSWSTTCSHCRVNPSNANDIVMDVDENSLSSKFDKLNVFDKIPELELRPIVTKPAKFNDMVRDLKKQKEGNEPIKYRIRSSTRIEETNSHHASSLSVRVVKEGRITMKEHKTSSTVRKLNSPGVRLRLNSPRIASKRLIQGRRSVSSSSSSSSRRSLSDSCAIVKSSFDPQRDFRESMVEMILENNISASKDLEELLACYLSLNSDEYHDLIISVFKQIWFDLTDVRLK